VAIPAVDADAAGVMLVTELDRLLDELICRGDEVRSLQRENDPAEAEHYKRKRNQAGFRPGVSNFWEYLRHVSCGPAVPATGLARLLLEVPKTFQLYPEQRGNKDL
jgi:hypothetical protein